MFKEPLAKIASTGVNINPSLYEARLPEPYRDRYGASASIIAHETSRFVNTNFASLFETERIEDVADSEKVIYANPQKAAAAEKQKKVENIYPQLVGNVVEFLTARISFDDDATAKEQAECLYFPQACRQIDDLFRVDPAYKQKERHLPKAQYINPADPYDGLPADRYAEINDDLLRLNTLLNRIDAGASALRRSVMLDLGHDEKELTELDGAAVLDTIRAACEFVAFWNVERGGRKRFPADGQNMTRYKMDIIPTKACARVIYRMIRRAMKALDGRLIQSYQWAFGRDITDSKKYGVNGGRLDLVADNIIFDFKTNTKEITPSDRLQIMLYLELMQHVKTKKPVNAAAIIDVRSNTVEWFYYRDQKDRKKFISLLLDALVRFNWNFAPDHCPRGFNYRLDAPQYKRNRDALMGALGGFRKSDDYFGDDDKKAA